MTSGTTAKTIDTLVEDIYALIDGDPYVVTDGLLERFGLDMQELMRTRLASQEGGSRTLRMSNLGKPDRQLYYEVNGPHEVKEPLKPNVLIKFLFGDLWETVLLYLAKEAGHTVEMEQAEVELNGIVGHIDAIIDGVVVDVKSASSYAFKKFKDGSLPENDPFGYMEQLAGYCTALGGRDGAFLAVDKQTGSLTLLRVPFEDLQMYLIEDRAEYLKEVVAGDTIPDRCYSPVEDGKSGNEVLGVNCSYCPFKFHCWSNANGGIGLRTFLYSTGPKHFVSVKREPKTLEVTF